MNVTILGGDLRSVYLARRMARDGHRVRCYGLEQAVECCGSLWEAMEETECVVLPTPAMDGDRLRTPLSQNTISPEALAGLGTVPVFAGAPGPKLRAICPGLIDLLGVESLAAANADLTAELALGPLLLETPFRLQGEPVLVLGSGRIAGALAPRLRWLGAKVTVAARAPGSVHMPLSRLPHALPGYRLVVNTIPARVLDTPLLKLLPTGAYLMELASAPGGFDQAAAETLGLHPIPAGGLPGRYAPESAAHIIADTIASLIGR